MKHPFFVSWSGGKDSCLALHRAVKAFGKPPACLLNMLTEGAQRSRSHGLKKEIIEAQAKALGVPAIFSSASWKEYESVFVASLCALKEQGIEVGVFGDIKISSDPEWQAHRKWADHVCSQASMIAYEPLWDDTEQNLLADFLASGIKAKIIAVDAKCLSKDYLGQELCAPIFSDLEKLGLNPLGERGEYHTVVIDCPLYSKPLELVDGEAVLRDGYWFLDVAPA